jgi:crotonobetainyl-CoA:carnitine CoA-transferase CaiB-like acyl-CoA transferase
LPLTDQQSTAGRPPIKRPQVEIGAAPTGPLAGVRIVDLSSVVMGPMATQILADMGADVIRVEPKLDKARSAPANIHRTPGMAPLFMQCNRNKRSIELDLKSDADRERLFALLETADVLVTNMRGSALQRLGIDYESLKVRFPGLIYAHGQGFNNASSQAARPAFDEVIQATSGVVNMNQRASGSLQFMPTYIADKMAGMYIVVGVLGALYHQRATGEGQLVVLAMADAMVALNTIEHLAGEVFVPAAGPVGNPLSFESTHRALATKDGKAIAAVAYTYKDVQRLLLAEAHPLADDPVWDEPILDRPTFYGGLEEVLANSNRLTLAEWERYLIDNDMPYGVVTDIADLPTDPYVTEMGLITEVDHPTEGRIRVVLNPLEFSATPVNIRRHAELPGQSTEAVFAEISGTAGNSATAR